jgi:CubicO group peptidase (beta-lactamase class C family)
MKPEDAIASDLQAVVDAGELAGVATLVWCGGRELQSAGVGWRDVGARRRLERDDLFRIASMTKPITTVAALMLLEEGRYTLEDPITRWVPELSRMRVLSSRTAPLHATVPARRPITVDDLLTTAPA